MYRTKSLLVTVYVLTYRKFDDIKKTIQSVLDQDYSQIELIVSDDGSPNFPYNEIVNYIEKNRSDNILSYKVLGNKQNLGTVKHINNVLKQANGTLLVPLAGDDIFYSSTVITKIVSCYFFTQFKVLCTSRAKYSENGNFVALMPHYVSRNKIATKMRTAEQQHRKFTESTFMDFASGSSMTYEAEFLRNMGYFDERYKFTSVH